MSNNMKKEARCVCYVFFFVICATFHCKVESQELPGPYASSQQCSSTPLALSSNSFGASLTKALGQEGNLFISPLSIYTALAMTYLGTRGRTAEQMEQAFQLSSSGLNGTELPQSFKDFLDVLKNSNDEYSLLLGNGIFLQQNFNVKQEYVDKIRQYYDALVKTVDFVNNGVTAKEEINRFVAEKTRNKIDEFLQEPLDSLTVMALLNAIYFKGTWQTQFPQDKTVDGIFHKSDGSTKPVKLMTLLNQRFRYIDDRESTNYKFLELPYKGGDISMLLALPNAVDQTPDLNMTSELLCNINGSMRFRKMGLVQLPKFQLKYRKELVQSLQALGIHDLFSNAADLTGISEDGNLKVSTVVHEAVIDVNEEGSEAAAATGVFITRMSVNLNEFVADHPFLFYIIDNRNGLILFSGRLSDP